MPPVVETWSPNYWAAREFPLDNGSKLAHLHHCYGDALVPGEVKKWSQMKSLSRVWLSVTPWTVAYQAPLSMGFSRQEYWNGLPFPSPRVSLVTTDFDFVYAIWQHTNLFPVHKTHSEKFIDTLDF